MGLEDRLTELFSKSAFLLVGVPEKECGAMKSGNTMRDLVRYYLGQLTDDECDFVLWELTPFPMVSGLYLRPYLKKVEL